MEPAGILRLELEGTGIRVSVLRCGNTKDTDFITREHGSEQLVTSNRLWFPHAVVRHTVLMTPDLVADAAASSTRPSSCLRQHPPEELPTDFEKFIEGVIRCHMPTSLRHDACSPALFRG